MPVLRAGRGERAAAHGRFRPGGRAVIARFRRPGPLALALVLTTAALSCVATNDMALIMMLPLSAATLMGANLPRLVAPVFVLLSLAANLCGMIVPFGNPQNLYLYSYYGLDLGDFLAAMALPFALSTAGIVACTWWLCGQSNGSCGRDDTRSLAVPMPLSRRRLAIYGALVALTLLAVFRIVPVAAAVAVVAAALAALDRRALPPWTGAYSPPSPASSCSRATWRACQRCPHGSRPSWPITACS